MINRYTLLSVLCCFAVSCDERSTKSPHVNRQVESSLAPYSGPSIDEMRAMIGLHRSDPEFREFVDTYKFLPQTKGQPETGPDSWASSIGVMILGSTTGRIHSVGVRVPGLGTNGNYTGPLPMNLRANNTLEDVLAYHGEPLKNEYDAYGRLCYPGFSIYFHSNVISEVWLLTPTEQ